MAGHLPPAMALAAKSGSSALGEPEDAPSATFAEAVGLWKFHRLAVGEPSVTISPTKGPAAGFKTLGLNGVRIPRPLHWASFAPPRPSKDPRHPAFKRFDARSVVLPNDKSVTTFLDSATITEPELRKLCVDDAHATTEFEHWKKITKQTGKLVSWFVARQGPDYGTIKVPRDYIEALDDVLEEYSKHSGLAPDKPAPAMTNPGWPLFTSMSPPAKVVGALLAERDGASTLATCEWFCGATGLPRATAGCFGLAGRSGPMNKVNPMLAMGPNGWYQAGEWKGYAQRNRVVQMGSLVWSTAVQALYLRLEGARRAIAQMWHAGPSAAKQLQGPGRHYEADISGYDVSVPPELKDIIAARLKHWYPDLVGAIDAWRVSESTGLITPSEDLDPASAFVVNAPGGWRSGNKLTSAIGSLNARAVGLMALRRQGCLPNTVLSDGSTTYLSMGDDQRIVTTKLLNTEQWAADWLECGFTCTLFEGYGFLSRATGAGLFDAPLAGRFVQQRMANEHEDVTRAALGIALLGFIAASDNTDQWPSGLSKRVMDVIQGAAWCGNPDIAPLLKPTTAATRAALVASPKVRAEIKRALALKEGEAFLVMQAHDADRSLTAQAVLAAAVAITGNTNPETTALDTALHSAINQTKAWPQSKRRSLAVEGYLACIAGRELGWRWLARAFNITYTPGSTAATLGDADE